MPEAKRKNRFEGKESLKGKESLIVCRCEEISYQEILEVIRQGIYTLAGIKRFTRAGMGLCQGRFCYKLLLRILQEEIGIQSSEVEWSHFRPPVRAFPLSVLGRISAGKES